MAGCGKGRSSRSSRSSGYDDYVSGMKERGFSCILGYEEFVVQMDLFGYITPEPTGKPHGCLPPSSAECYCIAEEDVAAFVDDDDVEEYERKYMGLENVDSIDANGAIMKDPVNELSVQDPMGYATPSGISYYGCITPEITPELEGKLSGHLSPSMALQSMDIPNGLANTFLGKKVSGERNARIDDVGGGPCPSSRTRFEELNIDDLRIAMSPAEKCLRYSGIDKHKVLEVVLVGGSTRTPKHEVKATAGDVHADGEDHDNRVADVRMQDCKRKIRGKGLALSRVRSEEPNKFYFRSATGPVERCLRDSGIVKRYSTIEEGFSDGEAAGDHRSGNGRSMQEALYNKMEVFNPASSMRGPAWHCNHRMCRAA